KLNTYDSYIIAAFIDKGNEEVIELVKEMMNSERNTEILTYQVISAVFCCDNDELHDFMCKLLVAARLSEGLRQAICESADWGCKKAFKKLVQTIMDNNLIRFAAIKRAIGTWTGLCRYEDPDRLANKIMDNITFVLESRDNAINRVNGDDPVDIYMGLWGIGFYNIYDALEVIKNITGVSDNNVKANELQLLTIGYFCRELGFKDVSLQITNSVIEANRDNYKIFAMFNDKYLYNRYEEKYATALQKKMYEDKELGKKHYDILLEMYNNIPKKEIEYKPMLYPWFSASVSKGNILYCMLNCAKCLGDNDKIDFICDRLSEFDTYKRSHAIERIGSNINSLKQRETVIKAVADKESYTRKCAVEILEKIELKDEEYEILEGFARYKTAELRSGVIKLLEKRDEKGIGTSISRMIKTKDENIRLAAMDMLLYAMETYKDNGFDSLKQELKDIDSPSDREQILIEKITGGNDALTVTRENGYNIYNPDAELKKPDFKADIKVVQDYFSMTKQEITEIDTAFLKLIDDNADMEYKDTYGNERIVGNMGSFKGYLTYETPEEYEEKVPLSKLCNKFYEEVIKTPKRLFCYSYSCMGVDMEYFKDEDKKAFKNNLKLFFGDIYEYDTAKEIKDERVSNYKFINMRRDMIDYIKTRFELSISYEVALNYTAYVVLNMADNEIMFERKKTKYSYYGDKMNIMDFPMTRSLIYELQGRIDENFELNFCLLHTFYKRLAETDKINKEYYSKSMSVLNYLRAYQMGIIDDDILFKSIIEIIGVANANRELAIFVKNAPIKFGKYNKRENNIYVKLLAEEGRELLEDDTIPKDSKLYIDCNRVSQTIIDKVLEVELKRGDSETVFSCIVKSISAIYGLDRLVEIIKALGNETLKTGYYYGRTISKKESLCHLLSVCYPLSDDNPEKLKKLLKGTQIKEDRLIEVAMFAPQWIDIIEGYLKVKGMKSGCYYFMAHTAETINNKREAIIAKYTPLTKEELNGGCFDVKWFNEVYDILGDKNFNKLYKSAKYSSSGNKHTRARKYADAALGKMDMEETKKQISDKRNKDLLMALAIIPSKGEADILDRYEFIQKFLKESKQFGAQRRASEGEASTYALKNLAVTAGYSDETRLILSMETALVKENKAFFEDNIIGDYNVKIEVDTLGKASLCISKGGKALKSCPAAIKKHEKLIEIKVFCDKLKQQYQRTVKMFENAMEEREAFSFKELISLCENPVTKAIVENIVFVNADGKFISGLIDDKGIRDCNGKVTKVSSDRLLRVAHPYDLYSNGLWSEYQNMILEICNSEGRKQPFRQVFRELYVKLKEELDKDKSLMFSGNQIQAQRTVGALKNRRWVADYEDGLQKIYYKDNIIATIYAEADWFSPADIEAPVLEGVYFADRKSYKYLKIEEVPDIIYSEIMRDVDLAVSVAHAGGVDPETSHSTVEMRRVILEFNLQLFGIKNVHCEKNHAFIDGKHGKYTIHLGSGVIHKQGGHQINVLSVSSGKKSKIFLPFIDEDPKTAEIMTKVLTFANDDKIKDPFIMEQIKS
ncbi:MAG: DUF4132 domain-containing protein, partial [Lachnospiraceae bacterium]|nr:DUF4132 domain-containing protein [Lachnospiraceae bacterium]